VPVEYRAPRPDEMRAFQRATLVGFGGPTSAQSIDRVLERSLLKPEWLLAAFDGPEVVSTFGTIPLTMRWHGRDVGCGAVTTVTTRPTHRRQGHLRTLMTRAFGEMRAAGQPVAMLWASMAAIYQRFGYGVAYTRLRGGFDPRTVRFVDAVETPGRLRMIPVEEAAPVLARAYDRALPTRTLSFYRDAEVWDRTILSSWDPSTPPYLVAVYEEDGDPLGYLVYSVETTPYRVGPDQRLVVREFVWSSVAAHRALIQYLIGHDLAYEVLFWNLPTDDPLPLHVQEPRLLGLQAMDGTLVRLVDVAAALEARGYQCDGRLTFSIDDDLCPWNAGTWSLTVEGGRARVQRGDAAPGLCVTPRSLAILAAGGQTAWTLARAGLLAGDEATLAAATALFRGPYTPYCYEDF
jgi:predicted acetyltransferase